jgi:hypothetical protein
MHPILKRLMSAPGTKLPLTPEFLTAGKNLLTKIGGKPQISKTLSR